MSKEVTVVRSSKKTISNGKNKYGFQIKDPRFEGEWINVVDWDNVHEGKTFSKGDKVHITKPENDPQYGWQANFAKEESSGGSGYSDKDVSNFTIERLLEGQKKLYNLILKVAKEMDLDITTKQGDIDYPNPKKGQSPEEIQEEFESDKEFEFEESLEDWDKDL